jgi:hypothetical protein
MTGPFFQVNDFLKETGGRSVNWTDLQEVGRLSLDVRKDLVETQSIRRITG